MGGGASSDAEGNGKEEDSEAATGLALDGFLVTPYVLQFLPQDLSVRPCWPQQRALHPADHGGVILPSTCHNTSAWVSLVHMSAGTASSSGGPG